MAISFLSHDTGNRILIGGQSALGGSDSGNIGPMPKFSINRSDISTDDGVYMGSKFDISIQGYATLSTYNETDLDTEGSRQTSIQNTENTSLLFNNISNAFGDGELEISPYGGLPNTIKFQDARIVSIELAEQDDVTSGTRYSEYSFQFEAYDDKSSTDSSNAETSPLVQEEKPKWHLSKADETWDLQPNGQMVYQDSDIRSHDSSGTELNKTYKTYTLTHTLSATGIRKYGSGAAAGETEDENLHAWRQAAGWIYDRLKLTSEVTDFDKGLAIEKGLFGQDSKADNEIKAKFNPFYMNKDTSKELQDLETVQYKARNRVRTIKSDISGGSYTVTDTYLVSLDQIKAVHEININVDTSITSQTTDIVVNGVVTGLTEQTVDKHSIDKYTNALAEYKKFFQDVSGSDIDISDYTSKKIDSTKIGELAKSFYKYVLKEVAGKKNSTDSNPFYKKVKSHQETHDKATGSINWSMTFTDHIDDSTTGGILSKSVQYTYSNDYRDPADHSDKLDSDGRLQYEVKGPPTVYQLIESVSRIHVPSNKETSERTLSIKVDATTDIDYRYTGADKDGNEYKPFLKSDGEYDFKPDGFTLFSIPSLVLNSEKYHMTSNSENWNPKTGVYSMTVNYVFYHAER